MERLRARSVLDDCRVAYQELLATADRNVYRRRWVAAVTLLRAVGHVLRNVDRERDETHRRSVDDAWQTPKPEIFTHFIEETRANTIKKYVSGAFLLRDEQASPMSYFDASAMASTEPSVVLTGTPNPDGDLAPLLRAPLPFCFADGPFEYESVYTVIESAIEYWEKYLAEIETAMVQSSSPDNHPGHS